MTKKQVDKQFLSALFGIAGAQIVIGTYAASQRSIGGMLAVAAVGTLLQTANLGYHISLRRKAE